MTTIKLTQSQINSIVEGSRALLNQLYELLTDEQKNMYFRMYPKGPTDGQVECAINQIKTTILNQNRNISEIVKQAEEYKKWSEISELPL
jgi:hypothetical protein